MNFRCPEIEKKKERKQEERIGEIKNRGIEETAELIKRRKGQGNESKEEEKQRKEEEELGYRYIEENYRRNMGTNRRKDVRERVKVS